MCFITNGIDGKKLIQIDANALPKMGITKFEDIQIITASLRTILNLDPLQGNRSIRLPPRNATGLFLEMKLTGNPVADHSIPRFEREVENRIFATTMANMGYAFNYPETNPPVMDSHF
ncbi:unnamed protein product [Hymenolepis diminuta]|uniref:SAM domain-containing protein n=1 Tax=Hymenolepis diminuta TaxID=6216 RepID=A0A564YRV1_HYMDI|nr:unnamed protein product [Hymenolepis diminuta]